MTFDVQKAVQTFAQEMQDLLDAVIPRPDDVPPEDRQVQVPFIEGRYAVRVAADRAKVALTKDGALIGYLASRLPVHLRHSPQLPCGTQVDLRATRIL